MVPDLIPIVWHRVTFLMRKRQRVEAVGEGAPSPFVFCAASALCAICMTRSNFENSGDSSHAVKMLGMVA